MSPRPCTVLYDDQCGWCDRWAARLARRHRAFQLIPLSSRRAAVLLKGEIPTDTMVVFEHDHHGGLLRYERSAALFAVLRHMGGIWALAALLGRLPRAITDPPYDLLARHRHRLPGSCRTSATRHR